MVINAAIQQSTQPRTESVVAGADLIASLESDALRIGFKPLRHDEHDVLLEADGVRLRLRAMPDGRCEIKGFIPREAQVAEFLLEGNDPVWWTGIENGLIVRCCAVADLPSGAAAIRTLRSITSLTARKHDMAMLRFLGKRPQLPPVPSAWVDLGCSILSRTRALVVRGSSLTDLWAWLSAILPADSCYMIRPEALLTESEKVARFLREESGVYGGLCIVVNMACLPNDATRALLLDVLAELSLADHSAGARVLFLCPNGIPLATSMPCLELPDFSAAEAGRADGDHAIRRVLTQGGECSEQRADDLLKSARRTVAAVPVHGVTVVKMATSGGAHVEWIRNCIRLLMEGFSDVAGHAEIKQKLARTIALWMAQGDDGPPLILAFAGPSGTGKNMLAERIATVFSDEGFFGLKHPNYVTINIGTAGDSKQWSLTGVGAGHVGAERKGLLEAACEHPGYVVTFDEIDKCIATGATDPQGFLVSVLENAGFRNGHGHWVPLAKGVIILTLNCGLDAAGEQFKPIGFDVKDRASARQAWVTGRYRDYYDKHVIAPLRGRVHQPFFFGELAADDLRQLAVSELGRRQTADAAIGLAWPQDDLGFLSDRLIATVDPAQGARGLMRQISRLHDEVLNELLQLGEPTCSEVLSGRKSLSTAKPQSKRKTENKPKKGKKDE